MLTIPKVTVTTNGLNDVVSGTKGGILPMSKGVHLYPHHLICSAYNSGSRVKHFPVGTNHFLRKPVAKRTHAENVFDDVS